MKLSEQQINAINALPAQKRYEHFVKQVADREQVWSLYQEGWAISSDDDGVQSLPVWPSREYAELLKIDEWETYYATSIELDEFLNEMLPDLALKHIMLAVAYVPDNEGVIVDADRLLLDIRNELKRY